MVSCVGMDTERGCIEGIRIMSNSGLDLPFILIKDADYSSGVEQVRTAFSDINFLPQNKQCVNILESKMWFQNFKICNSTHII